MAYNGFLCQNPLSVGVKLKASKKTPKKKSAKAVKKPEKPKKTKKGKSRKKRSVDPPREQNITTRSFTIVDEDPTSDLKLKDCRIWEESEGDVIETHVYDFERNVLIEDSEAGGSSLNATYFEDGVEEDAEEVPAPEEEEIET